jgi:cytoskeletal protein CcmA (bactofilin family)
MFSNKNRDSAAALPAVQSTVPALQAKRSTRTAAPSIISADLVVKGTLISTGDIQIDGCIEGDVHSCSLVIGDKAAIHGEILADDVTVRGRVQGTIRARKVLLCATSHVEGTILHESFAVESGAFFEGNCRHSDNPLADATGRKTADLQAKSVPLTGPAPTAVAPVPPAVKATESALRPAPSFAPLKSAG